MEEIKNENGKLICRVDPKTHRVEIVHKGVKTEIRFNANGTMQIIGGQNTAV